MQLLACKRHHRPPFEVVDLVSDSDSDDEAPRLAKDEWQVLRILEHRWKRGKIQLRPEWKNSWELTRDIATLRLTEEIESATRFRYARGVGQKCFVTWKHVRWIDPDDIAHGRAFLAREYSDSIDDEEERSKVWFAIM